jgi:PDDEXK-like domain of unknown function (DUF3799)
MKVIQWDGQRISKPGLYSNIPLSHYHRGDICDGPSISSTGLRLLIKKWPKHFWDKSALNPMRDDKDEENEDFILGRAAHHLVCREPGFTKYFVIRSDKAPDGRAWNGNNKTCKDWLAEQSKLGKSVLSPAQAEQIRGMALSLGRTPLVRRGILDGLIEHSMFRKDPETGVWLKVRPDNIPTSSGDFADLKTTQSVMFLDVQRALDPIFGYGYIMQGALVLEGAQALGMEINSFSLVWVEKTRPFCTRISTLIDEDIARGARCNRAALRKFHTCFINKSWPGPGDDRDDAEYLGLSEAARQRVDALLDLELREAA